MEIREFLGMHSSRLNADILADKMQEDPQVFETVWDIMAEDKDPVSMRAAWSISLFAEKHPHFFEPRVPEIVSCLMRIRSWSVRRSLLKLLTFLPLPDEQCGFLFDHCFGILESPASGIAHKAYAMTILYNISEKEPELKRELIGLFETQLDDASPGVRACSQNLLDRLYRDLAP